MTPHYEDESVTLWHGDCLDGLRTLPAGSVDALVTDPPYGLEFMGREWDGADGFRRSLNPADASRDNAFGRASRTSPEYRAGHLFQDWCEQWATECLRVLKPGAHLLAFGGSRTWHRLSCAIEDAGFEVRDSISWLYGSGFPKSLDVSKAIDKAAGAEREVLRVGSAGRSALGNQARVDQGYRPTVLDGSTFDVTSPATDAARQWSGWGTALKPAVEPIVVARKPLSGTVAANVLLHRTGALNVDGCRVATSDVLTGSGVPPLQHGGLNPRPFHEVHVPTPSVQNPAGRWPTNVVLTHGLAADGTDACQDGCLPGCPVRELDAQSGVSTSSGASGPVIKRRTGADRDGNTGAAYGAESRPAGTVMVSHGDSGGASRFFPTFRYEAKAPTVERPRDGETAHPTVKPLDLMRWLVRLVTPPGGVVLEPFAGSGTTAEACVIEGFRCIAIEREATYLPLIVARLSKPIQPDLFGGAA
jgi:site-specific DNA-methyltransferase (adenine-specific)